MYWELLYNSPTVLLQIAKKRFMRKIWNFYAATAILCVIRGWKLHLTNKYACTVSSDIYKNNHISHNYMQCVNTNESKRPTQLHSSNWCIMYVAAWLSHNPNYAQYLRQASPLPEVNGYLCEFHFYWDLTFPRTNATAHVWQLLTISFKFLS